ncbi:MAG TPA: VWA domain-containing protein [Thermoanaerobaculia bacterium]|nr:VWA domain-containing protein [Thermoanaerobaculia bacterium]
MHQVPRPHRGRVLVVLAVVAVLAHLPATAAGATPSRREIERQQHEAVAQLPEKHREWLAEVDPILTAEEKATFLGLAKDYQRDAFIKRFWEARDPYPRTARNEFQDAWSVKVQAARDRFKDLYDARARLLLLNGVPDEVVESNCPTVFAPLEVWYWGRAERLGQQLFLVFYQPQRAMPFRLWHPFETMSVLLPDRSQVDAGSLSTCGDADKHRKILYAIGWITEQPILQWEMLQARFDSPPPAPGGEWIAAFSSYSTDFPEGAVPLPARLAVEFPGRYQNRTVVQGVVTVAPGDAGLAQVAAPGIEYRSHDFLLTGEVLANGELFDSFRYKFDLPGSDQPAGGESLPLAFQRYLRPGEYTLILKLEDVNSGRIFREERALAVPSREQEAAAAPAPADPTDLEMAHLLAEANAAIGRREVTLKILPPAGTDNLPTGLKRFDTYFTGEIAAVVFTLNGKPILTKKRPPYSVELDLGSVPQNHLLIATAVDSAGNELASDEIQINTAPQRFRVRLVEPRRGKHYTGSLLARAELDVPEGQTIERVEIFLDEARVATLYQSPWEQPVVLPPGGALSYVRAVAYLPDGNSTEALVFVNAPDSLEEIRVDLVELYTTALDGKRRPVADLQARDFTVLEDGVRQEIARFERVTDLPVHVAVALDTSSSMEKSLPQARDAALGFLQRTIRPKDRAAVVTFNDHPNLGSKLTSDLTQLAGGLAGLKAERSTALYDAMIFSLYYFSGLRGRRALLLLSDGRDEGSRFTFEEALEYSRRSGVTIYVIGLGEDVEKKKLGRFAEETGGRAFFLKNAADLPGIYAAIEDELRSQYLIAYQSTNNSGNAFRTVDVEVERSGVEVRTLRGYYP